MALRFLDLAVEDSSSLEEMQGTIVLDEVLLALFLWKLLNSVPHRQEYFPEGPRSYGSDETEREPLNLALAYSCYTLIRLC